MSDLPRSACVSFLSKGPFVVRRMSRLLRLNIGLVGAVCPKSYNEFKCGCMPNIHDGATRRILLFYFELHQIMYEYDFLWLKLSIQSDRPRTKYATEIAIVRVPTRYSLKPVMNIEILSKLNVSTLGISL